MELLITLVILAALAGPVALILAILAMRRAGRLEQDLRLLKGARSQPVDRPVTPKAPSPVPVEAVRPAASARPVAPSRVASPPRPTVDFETILGGQWLTWAGILALFCGTAFFLGVDLEASPLSGLPQVLIGLAVAAAFMYVGHRLAARDEQFLGLGLLGGGVGLLYLALFASYGFHHLVPLLVVFPMLLAVAAVGAILALRRNSLTIASLTLMGAILTPIILLDLAADPAAYDALLPYLVAVNLGAVLVGLRRGWAGLPLAGFVATLFMVSDWWSNHPRTDPWAFLFVTGSWAVFAAAPWLLRQDKGLWTAARVAVLSANGLFYALFCHHQLAAAGRYVQGSAVFFLGGLYVASSLVMKSRRGEDPASRLSHATGSALAVLAIPVLLDTTWVTLGWTALAGLLIMTGLREKDLWQRVTGLAVLVLVVLRSLVVDIPVWEMDGAAYRPLVNGGFFAGLAVLALMGWTFWAYHRYETRLSGIELRARSGFLVFTVLILLWKLTFELVGFFRWREATLGLEAGPNAWLWGFLLWSVFGLAVTLVGFRARFPFLRSPGYCILAMALAGTALFSMEIGVDLVGTYHLLLNLPFIQGIVLAGALGILAWRMSASRDVLSATETRLITPVLLIAILVLFGKVSLEVLAFFRADAGVGQANLALKSQLTLSLVWGLYAGTVIAAGFVRRFKPVRLLGIGLLGLTVLKVFLVDIGSLDRGYRIVAFVALGVLLLTISLLYQKERARMRGGAE